MYFDESKHPRDGDGKFTDKGGGEAKRVFELADELGIPYDRDTSYQTLKAKVEEAQKNDVQRFAIILLTLSIKERQAVFGLM